MPIPPHDGSPGAPPTLPSQAPQQDTLKLSWRQPQGLYSLSFVNFLLRIVTLGIYTFWARTEVRKRVWSGIRLNGQPLQYTGTGGELFKGFAIIFVVVIIPLLLVSVAATLYFGPDTQGQRLVSLAMYLVIFYLFGMGTYRAWRYRLSRTRWRGIRAGLVGSDTRYAGRYFWTGMLIPLTLGWIVPWRTTRLQELITDDTQFGNRPFEFTAMARTLYLPFTVLWLGAIGIIVLGYYALLYFIPPKDLFFNDPQSGGGMGRNQMMFVWILKFYVLLGVGYLLYTVLSAWYRARQFNHFSNHTFFESGRLHGSMRWPGLLWITVSNYLIVFLTLGILAPIAQARMMRYIIEHLEFVGTAPLQQIAQNAAAEPNLGEGLAQAFDIDGF